MSSFPTIFKVFPCDDKGTPATVATKEDKQALRKLTKRLALVFGSKLYTKWNPACGQTLVSGPDNPNVRTKNVGGYHILLECSGKRQANLVKNKFWGGPQVAEDKENKRVVQFSATPKAFTLELAGLDVDAFITDNLGEAVKSLGLDLSLAAKEAPKQEEKKAPAKKTTKKPATKKTKKSELKKAA